MSESGRQPTYKRQRFLLAFVRQLQSSVSATDLQKLIFLHTMAGDSDYYEFIPYKFGAYSFQLKEDLEILQRDGFIQNDTRIKATGEHSQETFFDFDIPSERGDALIRKAYREYPYYTINSEITEKHFYGEELKQLNAVRQNYAKSEQVLFSIGYEGRNIEAFINILIQNDVRLLCDVRKNPLSRKFGFSKGKLGHITQTVGIKYVHIPELGIEYDKRCSLETPEDYTHLFNDYKETLPKRMVFLDEVYTLFQNNSRIALMCFEREPEMCHRHVIRDYFVRKNQARSADV